MSLNSLLVLALNDDFSFRHINVQLCKFGFQIALYSCHCFLPQRKFRTKLYSQQIQQFALPNVPSEVPGLEICSPPRTVFSNKSHNKVDFHILFQYKPRSVSFTTNTFASTQLSPFFNCPFFSFSTHIRLVLRKKAA